MRFSLLPKDRAYLFLDPWRRPRAYRQFFTEVFLLKGCVGGICSFAALFREEGLFPHLGNKALNLTMVITGGPSASRADVLPLPT